MSLSFGFYNSVDEDRKYNSVDISRIFDGIINDGVYSTIGDYFMVSEDTGMTVTIGTGRAWFNHTWSYNDGNVPVTLNAANALYDRYDVVYLEINAEEAVRANSFGVLTGTPAAVPEVPELTETSNVHQYPLAVILVPAGSTYVSGEDIENKVGTDDCPFVTGLLDQVTVEDLLVQWELEWDAWFAVTKDEVTAEAAAWDVWLDAVKDQVTVDKNAWDAWLANIETEVAADRDTWESEWDAWFDTIKDQLSTEAETNLQNQIWAIVGDINPPLATILELQPLLEQRPREIHIPASAFTPVVGAVKATHPTDGVRMEFAPSVENNAIATFSFPGDVMPESSLLFFLSFVVAQNADMVWEVKLKELRPGINPEIDWGFSHTRIVTSSTTNIAVESITEGGPTYYLSLQASQAGETRPFFSLELTRQGDDGNDVNTDSAFVYGVTLKYLAIL
jgi:hypothetical protein